MDLKCQIQFVDSVLEKSSSLTSYTFAYVYTYTYKCMHIRICIHMYTRIYTHTSTYIYINKRVIPFTLTRRRGRHVLAGLRLERSVVVHLVAVEGGGRHGGRGGRGGGGRSGHARQPGEVVGGRHGARAQAVRQRLRADQRALPAVQPAVRVGVEARSARLVTAICKRGEIRHRSGTGHVWSTGYDNCMY